MPSSATQVADEVAAYYKRLLDKGLDPQLAADATRDLAHAVHHGHYPYAVVTTGGLRLSPGQRATLRSAAEPAR